jgi:hypothetical protein
LQVKNKERKPKLAVLPTKPTLGKMQGQGECPESNIFQVKYFVLSGFSGQPCILSRTANLLVSLLFFLFFFSFKG